MKKRNCRLTPAERERHEEAVKLRKMTDEQICAHLDEIRSAGYKAGYSEGKRDRPAAEAEDQHRSVKDFLARLTWMAGTGNGIGPGTVAKVKVFAKKEKFVDE